jgi:tyrosine-protein phosphatase YwqE
MIDIHLYILPGIDDGPETLPESLTLAEALVQEGIHGAVEAPHDTDEFEHSSAAEVRGRVAETLLKKGLIHCIGSDGHGLRSGRPELLMVSDVRLS